MSQNIHSLSDSDQSPPSSPTIINGDKPIAEAIVPPRGSKIKRPRKQRLRNSSPSKPRKAPAQKKKIDKFETLTVKVSNKFLNNPRFSLFLGHLQNLPSPIDIVDTEEDSITWIRRLESGEDIEEPYILIIWDHIKLLKLKDQNLVKPYFSQVKFSYPNYRVYLIVYGLKDYCKRLRNKSNVTKEEKNLKIKPSKNVIHNLLSDLLIIYDVESELIDDLQDLFECITVYTESVADNYEVKEEDSLLEAIEDLDEKDYRSTVITDENDFGMVQLWHQQLARIPRSSLDIAKAISLVYPTPLTLFQAYEKLDNISDREKLLQDIPVGQGKAYKRVGPKLSKKLSILFSCDGNKPINCEGESDSDA